MSKHSAFFLLSFLNIYEAQAAALTNFYRTSTIPSSVLQYKEQTIPSVNSRHAETQKRNFSHQSTSLELPRRFASSSLLDKPSPIVVSVEQTNFPSFSSDEYSDEDLHHRSEGTSVASPRTTQPPLMKQINARDTSTSTDLSASATSPQWPSWMTSPYWALYSFSASLYPSPSALPSGDVDTAASASLVDALPSATSQDDSSQTISTSDLVTALAVPDPTPSTSLSSVDASPSTTASPTPTFSSDVSSSTGGSPTLSSTSIPSSSVSASTPIGSASRQQPSKQSSSNTTAIAVGVVVPVIVLIIIISAVVFALLRQRRRRSSQRRMSNVGSTGGRFGPGDNAKTKSGLTKTLSTPYQSFMSRILRSPRRLMLPSVSSAREVDSEKGATEELYDPPPPDRQDTAIISKPGRSQSPSRPPQIEHQVRRHESGQASLTDMSGNDTRSLDFHCEGEPSNSSRRVGSALPQSAKAAVASAAGAQAASAHAGGFAGKGKATGQQDPKLENAPPTSWFSMSSNDSTPRSSAPDFPLPQTRSTVPPAVVPRLQVYDEVGVAMGSPTISPVSWNNGQLGPYFDSYHPGIGARDFALGNFTQSEQRESARTSISLSSGPWSDSEDEEMVEVPLTWGNEVEPGVGVRRS